MVGQSSCVTFCIFFLSVGPGFVPGVVSDVSLTSNPSTNQLICPGETIEFTCTTTGSSRLSWTSDEYIGVGSQFEFRSIDSIGTTETSPSNPDTIANLTSIDDEILTSTLQIATTSTIPSSTVTCINGGLGTTNTSTIQVAAVPGAPQNLMAVGSMDDCMIQVTWDPPADTGGSDYTYRVYIPSRNITAGNNSSTESILHVPDCDDDILIQVYVVNRFGCLMSSETRLRLQSRPTEFPSQLGAGAIAGIAIGSAIILCSPCAVITAIVLCFCCWIFCTPDESSTVISTSESHKLAEILKTEDVDSAESQKKAIVQAKECYQQQSKHDFDELGTEDDRVSVPIWIDSALDHSWKASLREAVKVINEAAPGLSLTITEDKKRAIIHVLATDKLEAYTEGSIQLRFIPTQADYITKIHLGKWEDDREDGISTRELFHALGFRQADNLGLTRFDPLSITLMYQSKETHNPAAQIQGNRPGDPVWRLINPFEENTKLSELDKVGLNLVYRPCRDTRVRANNAGYTPKLGKTGMYYCGRPVMSGHTYPGDNYYNTDGICGPDDGPNCPACRTIKSPKMEDILDGGKWQGMTGRVYCGRLFSEPGEIDEHHDGACGMDNGPACSDCNDLLNRPIEI